VRCLEGELCDDGSASSPPYSRGTDFAGRPQRSSTVANHRKPLRFSERELRLSGPGPETLGRSLSGAGSRTVRAMIVEARQQAKRELLRVGRGVPVDLGYAAVRVTDPVRDLPERNTGPRAVGDEGVSQIMEPDLAQTGPPYGGFVDAGDEVPCVDWVTGVVREDEVEIVRPHPALWRSSSSRRTGRMGTLRRLLSVFGRPNTSVPPAAATLYFDWRFSLTWTRPPAQSISAHRSATSSPCRSPA
jgi:hypothetical protein